MTNLPTILRLASLPLFLLVAACPPSMEAEGEPPSVTFVGAADGRVFLPSDPGTLEAAIAYTLGVDQLQAEVSSSAMPDASASLAIEVDGVLGTVSFAPAQLGWPPGSQVLTLTVVHPDGPEDHRASDAANIQILASDTLLVSIDSPDDGGVFATGELIVLGGTVSDPDGLDRDLSAVWEIDAAPLGPAEAPGAGGTVRSETNALEDGEHTVTLVANDGFGRTGSASITVEVLPAAGYDGDGDCSCPSQVACTGSSEPSCSSLVPGDCDDSDPTVHPGATELCDAVDHDCDGAPSNGLDVDADMDGVNSMGSCNDPLDCDDNDPLRSPNLSEAPCDGLDNDCDVSTTDTPDADGDGVDACLDCDDADPTASPLLSEAPCDGVDNDCDPLSLDGPDADGDGESACTDCDDADPQRSHLHGEVACDGLDNDCDAGTVDTPDADGDGVTACADCDDNDPAVSPLATETVCDGVDNDCTPGTPDDEDADADAWTLCGGDCDDTDPAIHPGTIEVPLDGLDNDCDPSTLDNSCAFTADPSLAVGEGPDQAGMTAAHNYWRHRVGVGRLQWDAGLAATAQAWADNLAATCTFQHSFTPGLGENLYATSYTASVQDPAESVDAWACERKNYLWPETIPNCTGPIEPPTPACSWVPATLCGHYTQVVWEGSTHVGCGVAIDPTCSYFGGGGFQVWVCNYSPPGNWIGQAAYPDTTSPCVDLDNDDAFQDVDADDRDRSLQ
jgi:hypothetical protein